MMKRKVNVAMLGVFENRGSTGTETYVCHEDGTILARTTEKDYGGLGKMVLPKLPLHLGIGLVELLGADYHGKEVDNPSAVEDDSILGLIANGIWEGSQYRIGVRLTGLVMDVGN